LTSKDRRVKVEKDNAIVDKAMQIVDNGRYKDKYELQTLLSAANILADKVLDSIESLFPQRKEQEVVGSARDK